MFSHLLPVLEVVVLPRVLNAQNGGHLVPTDVLDGPDHPPDFPLLQPDKDGQIYIIKNNITFDYNRIILIITTCA